MTKTRSTKRALIASVISVLLCVSMLLGTTYAWFTDSVTSANNIIVSGNLDIELEYWNGTEWVSVEGKTDILTNELFEPGTTEVAYLRVANAGTLALKYQLGVNVVSETAGVNAAGESFLGNENIEKHAEWFDRFKGNYTFTEENSEEIIKTEIGKTFVRVLEDAGVYKVTEEGRAAFLKFIDFVNN